MALFPIHDLARADDIRMRRRRAVMLLAGIVVVIWMLFGPQDRARHHRHRDAARAMSEHRDAGAPMRTFRSASLVVDLPCASSITLLPRYGLGDQVLVSARHGQNAALQAVGVAADGRLGQSGSCDEGGADFTLQIAVDQAFQITQTGAGEIRGGDFRGAVRIVSDGSGSVTLDGVGALTDSQSGSGDVAVGSVSGGVTARLSGSGDLQIRSGTVTDLDASSTGSGDIGMGSASIGSGRLVLGGSGDFSAEKIAGGSLAASTSGGGDIRIDSLYVGDVQLRGSGSGDIVLRGGQIGELTADRQGSGDLVVDAVVSGSHVSHGGSGDVRLPNSALPTDDD